MDRGALLEAQGFTFVPNRRGSGGGICAYQILHKVYSLSDGERVSFPIQFYSEHERYRENPKPFSRFLGMGERLPDGSVQLPERALRGEGRSAPRSGPGPLDACKTGGLPRKSVRLFANDAAQSTLRRRLFDHASNLANKCGTERTDRLRRHQIIGFIDLHPVIFVHDQP